MLYNTDPRLSPLRIREVDPVISAVVKSAFERVDTALRSNFDGVGVQRTGTTDATVFDLTNFDRRTSTTVMDYDVTTATRVVTIVGKPTSARGETTVVLQTKPGVNFFIDHTLDIVDAVGRVRDEADTFHLLDTMRLTVTAPEAMLGELAVHYLGCLVFVPHAIRTDANLLYPEPTKIGRVPFW